MNPYQNLTDPRFAEVQDLLDQGLTRLEILQGAGYPSHIVQHAYALWARTN